MPIYETIMSLNCWYIPIATSAIIFSTGNTVAHALRLRSHQRGRLWIHAFTGLVDGALLGTLLCFSKFIPKIGITLQTVILIYTLLQGFIGILGVLTGMLNKGVFGIKLAIRIFLGLFYIDESSPLRAIVQGFLRHSWEIPQTFAGQAASHIRNASSNVARVDYYGGATFVINDRQQYQEGLNLGNYINVSLWYTVNKDFYTYVKTNPLLLHEYGHTIDSNIFGWLYLLVIGVPSVHSAMGKGNHQQYWTEKRANRKVKKYAQKYHNIAWDTFEEEYPTT